LANDISLSFVSWIQKIETLEALIMSLTTEHFAGSPSLLTFKHNKDKLSKFIT
jgi:hypothetical protein